MLYIKAIYTLKFTVLSIKERIPADLYFCTQKKTIVQCCRIPGERIEEISGGAETGNILQRELEIGNPTEKENVAD